MAKRTNNDLSNLTQKTKDRIQLKTDDELMCSGRVKYGKDRELLTTNGTYLWSFVIQI